MVLFKQIIQTVRVTEAAKYYGLEISSNLMTHCLFHHDRDPSMKLDDNIFYCFGCGANGNVIDLTARLFHLSSYQAAQKLAQDFGIDPDKPPAAMALQKPDYVKMKAFGEKELYCRHVLCEYLDLLNHWKRQHTPQTPQNPLDKRFVEACQMLDSVEYLADLLPFEDLKKRMETVNMLIKSDTVYALEQRLNRLKKEVQGHDEERSIA